MGRPSAARGHHLTAPRRGRPAGQLPVEPARATAGPHADRRRPGDSPLYLLQLHFPVGDALRRAKYGVIRLDRCVALNGDPVGLGDGPQAGGDPRGADGDGLAVASAIGAPGQLLAKPLDLANVGFSFISVSSDGVEAMSAAASMTRMTVWVSGSRRASTRIREPPVSGQACSGTAWPCLARSRSLRRGAQ